MKGSLGIEAQRSGPQPMKGLGYHVGDEGSLDHVPMLKARQILPSRHFEDVPGCVIAVRALKVGLALFDDISKGSQGDDAEYP